MADNLKISIGEISQEDDLRPAYQGAYDQREKNAAIDWLNDGDDTTPEPAPQMRVAAPPEAATAPDDTSAPQDANAPWWAGQGETDPLNELSKGGAQALAATGADIASGIAEAPRQIYGGVVDAIGEIDQFMQEALPIGGMRVWDEEGNFDPSLISHEDMVKLEKEGKTFFDAITSGEAKSTTGGIVRAGSKFLTGFLPGLSAFKAAGYGSAAAGMLAGGIADMVTLDPNEARLSTFLNEVPGLQAVVPDYLAAHGGDESDIEGRVKNAIEGAGLGIMAEGLMKAFKYYKAQRALPPQPEAEGALAQAAKDEKLAADRAQIETEVTDQQLAPLGDASDNAPLIVEGAPTENLTTALQRIREADERVANSAVRNDAIAKINQIVEGRKRPDATPRAEPIGPDAAANTTINREAIDDALDELRSGAVSKAKFPARPVARIVTDLGGIDPSSSLAGDLRSRGITAKSFPGLYKRGGLQSLDNVPGVEHNLFLEQGRIGPDGYIDQQAFIDGLEAELKGDPWRTADQQQQISDIVAPAQELEESLSRLGIDYENMSNQAVKDRLNQIVEEERAFQNYQESAVSRIDDGSSQYRSLADLEGEQREIWTVEQTAEARAAGVDEATIASKQPNKVYINMARIRGAEDVKALIQTVADHDAAFIKDKARGVVSNEQTIKESSKEYQDLEGLIGRAPGPMSAAQAVAARKVLASSSEQVLQLAKIAASPNAGKVDQYNLMRALSVHGAIQSEVIAARTETARALQSWAIPTGADRIRTEAITDLLDRLGGGDVGNLAKAIANAGDAEAMVNSTAKQLLKTTLRDAGYQIWINGLLSGPKTHLANIFSNAAVSLYAIPERYLAAGFSKAFYNGEIQTGEVAAQAFGMVQGIRDGFRLAVKGARAEGDQGLADVFDAFVKGEGRQPGAISAKAFGMESNGGLAHGIDMMGKFIDIPGSALEAEDRFFKTIGYRMELNALAFRQAHLEGLEGKDFAKRMADIIENPPADLKAKAVDAARIQTFTNPLGEAGRNFQRLTRNTALRWVVPFVRTPTNIMKFTFARTPLAYASASIRSDIAAGGARAAQAHARVALGSMIMMTVGSMSMDGIITGGGPKDPKINAAWRAGGNQPYSVKIGDKWFSYSRLDPIGMMIGIASDITEISNSGGDEDATELAVAGAVALAQNLASKTYMQGVFDFIGAVDPRNPTKDIGTYLMDQASGLMPYSALIRQINQGIDPVRREVKAPGFTEEGEVDPMATFLNRMINSYKRNIPGLSGDLPPVRDIFGEEMTNVSGVGAPFDMLLPIQARTDKNDPVVKAIVDNEVKVSKPSDIVRGVKLSAEQYDQLQQIAGPMVRQRLDILVKSPGFKNASDGPDGMKASLIERMVKDAHDLARNQLLATDPELRQRFIQKQVKTRNTLLGN